MTSLGLLVSGASPLITLAAADALDCLTLPGLRVAIPDMVHFEVTQDLARTGAAVDADPGLEAVLLFEDNDIRTRRFVLALPERVVAISTGDLLHELERAGRIQSSDRILDAAAEKERNVERQRRPTADEAGRLALRSHLRSMPRDD